SVYASTGQSRLSVCLPTGMDLMIRCPSLFSFGSMTVRSKPVSETVDWEMSIQQMSSGRRNAQTPNSQQSLRESLGIQFVPKYVGCFAYFDKMLQISCSIYLRPINLSQ